MKRAWPKALDALDRGLAAKASSYPPPFAERMKGRDKRALGDLFGLKNFGVNITRIAPGGISALRHYHRTQDEFVFVLQGRPTLVTQDAETQLEPGMCAGFPAGDEDGHQLVNRTAQEVVYLEIGDRSPGDAAAYPDDDLKAELGPDGRWRYLHKDGKPY
jgi:uncharacterized cupin superfamily protein